MSECDECNLGYVDFGNCFQCKGNPCEKEVRADERRKTIKEVYERFNSDLGSFGFWLYEQMEELKNDKRYNN